MRLALTPYLLLMGLMLLRRGLRHGHPASAAEPRGERPPGLLAGFADAISGGGWCALTVTTLVAASAALALALHDGLGALR